MSQFSVSEFTATETLYITTSKTDILYKYFDRLRKFIEETNKWRILNASPFRVRNEHVVYKQNSAAFSSQANYTAWAPATDRQLLVPAFVHRGVSRGQRAGTTTAVNGSFLDLSRYFTFK
jgi:hypothetical protein